MLCTAITSLVVALAVSPTAQGHEGETNCNFGATDCNVCAENVATQFYDLKSYGEVLGFRMGVFNDDVKFEAGANHWQGIARLSSQKGKFLALTTGRSGGDVGAKLRVVEMRSRNDKGRRFRSNRMQKKTETDDTYPPYYDRGVKQLTPDSRMKHGGGIQSVGDWLAVPLDKPKGCSKNCDSKIVFYNMNNPESPSEGLTITRHGKDAGVVAVTKLANGKFLLAVGGFDGGAKLDLYYIDSLSKSGTPVLKETLDLQGSDLKSGCWPRDSVSSGCGWSFQGMSFVNQCDGRIFLVGMQNTDVVFQSQGDDRAFLYELVEEGVDNHKLSEVERVHLHCNWWKSGHPCNFAAAGSAFVDADKNLILYSSEHANDGPGGSVKMVEFRNKHGNWKESCSESDGSTSWIEIFENKDFKKRSIVLDYLDQPNASFEKLQDLDDFNDKASSIRWCISPSCKGYIYQHDNYKGKKKELTGKGSRSDLHTNWDGRKWGDDITSLKIEC